MSNIGTKFAVVVKDVFHNEQHYERHRPSYYVAVVISNTQGSEMTREGRQYYFGGTKGEVCFWECDSEEKAKKLAGKFNRLWEKGLFQHPSKL